MLPSLRPPAGSPCFLTAGHAAQPGAQHENLPRRGHDRKRRTRTTVPTVADVAWILTAEQMTAVDAWFEDVLQAGRRRFSARLRIFGRILWWNALWLQPYTSEPIAASGGLLWRVVGRLHLVGEGEVDPPAAYDLTVAFGLALKGSGALVPDTALSVDFGLALMPNNPLTVAFGLSLDGVYVPPVVEDRELREDGGYELREDGGYELRD